MKRKVKIKEALKNWRQLPLAVSFKQVEEWVRAVEKR